ncbi:MAG: PhzF family phenazine biosynthesis protein [Thermodesulfovibrionia bacterium]|nr:PhzF family phenazine biosynthesis protein [Thermodesulfovibrionia bacterium]
MKNPFYILDVFAQEKYSGNQLAVVRNAASISDAVMQKIAKEINFSETAFILSDDKRNGAYDVRIFTPAHEIPFAGHPVLGTAYVIQQEIIKECVDSLILNLKIGQITVTINYKDNSPETLWMRQIQPVFGEVIGAEVIAEVLGLDADDIDSRYPVQEVSTGLPFIITPLKGMKAVKKCSINKDKYLELINKTEAKAIFVFSPETYEEGNDLNARMFADYYGIPEDPATGSANGCLGGYLVKHGYFRDKQISIRVEQGYEIGRRSLILVNAEEKGGAIDISVGGKVIMVSRGELV